MHDSSLEKMSKFVEVYLDAHRDRELEIVDVGSQIVVENQRTYRDLLSSGCWTYRGLDVSPGLNVDIPVADPYRWDELDEDSVDVVVSGQALEHIPMFWLTAFEIGRILKPGGITMLIAPSSGFEHRFPVDCWRFYRDGMTAIAEYLEFEVLDVYTEWGRPDWADSILVMRKPIWGDDRRHRFAFRRELQQAAARGCEPRPTVLSPAPSASPLESVVGGRLSPELEAIRVSVLGPPWRQRAREIAGTRVLALYRRLRYGRGN